MRNRIPKGSIIISKPIASEYNKLPANKKTRILVTLGLGSSSFFFILIVFSCIFNFWHYISNIFAFNLPIWLNWIGIIGIWLCYGWGVLVMYYNVNYKALFKPMKGQYILATGGPYKFVRHPMYTEKIFVLIFLFLATGVLLILLGLLGFIWLPKQAKGEEQLLLELFGEQYLNYMNKKGRFLPKLKLK
ncbi:MAG: methyltransferase family protein [Candidatus Hodarchaeota archaeon]